MISHYRLRNYRCFSEAEVELRPITLFFGYNNSGKSALLRALGLIAESIGSSKSNPIDLEADAARGADFRELPRRTGKNDEIGLGLTWQHESVPSAIGVDVTIQDLFDEERLLRQQVTQFELRYEDTQVVGQIELEDLLKEAEEEKTYALEVRQGGTATKVLLASMRFSGFLPDEIGRLLGDNKKLDEQLSFPVSDFGQQFQWLSSLRSPPARRFELRVRPKMRLRPDGTGAARILAYDQLSGGNLLEDVSRWYEKVFQRELTLIDENGALGLGLSPVGFSARPVNLVDTGEGMAQSLPVLVAFSLAQRRTDQPYYLAIEQPELHIHRRVQPDLAARLTELAASNPKARVLLETHSENLLLSIRLEVARGNLEPEDVIVYFISQDLGSTSLHRVTLDRSGRLEGAWPDNVFGENYEIAREILKQQRNIDQ
jgi:hypothetical protein